MRSQVFDRFTRCQIYVQQVDKSASSIDLALGPPARLKNTMSVHLKGCHESASRATSSRVTSSRSTGNLTYFRMSPQPKPGLVGSTLAAAQIERVDMCKKHGRYERGHNWGFGNDSPASVPYRWFETESDRFAKGRQPAMYK